MTVWRRSAVLAVFASLMAGTTPVVAQQPGQSPGHPQRSQPPGDHHGTASGWKFTWSTGDPAKGREVFAKFECYACHEVKGETFQAPKDRESVGPELAGC